MEQKCSIWKVFNVFCEEPLKMQYIRVISKKIKLAPTSVKKHIEELQKKRMIIKKKGDLYEGYIANRENDEFVFYKKINNIIAVKKSGIIDFLVENLHPDAIVLYGSFFRGEDTESSDVDLLIVSKNKAIKLDKYENILKRKIHLIIEKDFRKIIPELRSEIFNGLVMYGYLQDR